MEETSFEMVDHVIIHIGNHKTGSTSIQRTCVKNEALLSEQGVFYPTEDIQLHGHHPIAWALGVNRPWKDPDFRWEPVVERYLKDSRGRKVLLSSEDFEFAQPDMVHEFLDWLSQRCARIDVICYLRNPADYLLSVFKAQSRRNAHKARTMADFLASVMFERLLSYDEVVQKWHQPGLTEMNLRVYTPDIFTDFFSLFGVDSSEFKVKKTNVSPKGLTAKLTRLIVCDLGLELEIAKPLDEQIRELTDRDVELLGPKDLQRISEYCTPRIHKLLDSYLIKDGESLLGDGRRVRNPLDVVEERQIALDAIEKLWSDQPEILTQVRDYLKSHYAV